MQGAIKKPSWVTIVAIGLLVAVPSAVGLLDSAEDEVPSVTLTAEFIGPLLTRDDANVGLDRDANTYYFLTDLYNGSKLRLAHGLTTDGTVDFQISTPNTATENDTVEFLLDFNNNGRANFRYVFDGNGIDYQEPFWVGTQNNPVSCGWESAEPNAQLSAVVLSGNSVLVSVPLAFIVNTTPDYRYAVNNVDTEIVEGADISQPLPESLDLHNEAGGISDQDGNPCGFQSTNYQRATFGL